MQIMTTIKLQAANGRLFIYEVRSWYVKLKYKKKGVKSSVNAELYSQSIVERLQLHKLYIQWQFITNSVEAFKQK